MKLRCAVTKNNIPLTQWSPLLVPDTIRLFAKAPFAWGLAGGFAIEQFVGHPLRSHSDVDVLIFRDNQLLLQQWLNEWHLFAADPPGELREWETGEYLPIGINDIWGHAQNNQCWQIQLMLMEVTGDTWYSRRNDSVRGHRNDLIVQYAGVPCIRVEVLLLFKSKNIRPKDDVDFHACLPKMTARSKQWLSKTLGVLYPDGHQWQSLLG
jgi:hypothetical protein